VEGGEGGRERQKERRQPRTTQSKSKAGGGARESSSTRATCGEAVNKGSTVLFRISVAGVISFLLRNLVPTSCVLLSKLHTPALEFEN